MLITYFKIAWRSLFKNPVSSVLNIAGLSIGLATAIIILFIIQSESAYDKFHANLESIHLVMTNEKLPEGIVTGRITQGPLGPDLKNELPELKYVARMSQPGTQLIRYGDKSLYEKGMYAEADFFRMMSFPAVEGDIIKSLANPGSIVLTERTALKLFGKDRAVGKTLVLNNSHNMLVTAIIRNIPENSSTQFDVLLPFGLYEKENESTKRWDHYALLTWIQLQPNAELKKVNAKINELVKRKQNEVKNTSWFLYPLKDLRLHGRFSNGKPSGGLIDTLMMLGFIGLFVLLIACINFMNLATARSERRAREVGVRKVMGATRSNLVFQFITEAMLLTVISLGCGLVLARLAIPATIKLIGNKMTPDFSNPQLWILIAGLGIFTGFIAGSYPALYLSRFQPVRVLKNLIFKAGNRSLLRSGLVTFQFIISGFLIIAVIVLLKQSDHLQNRPIGYDPENLVRIPANGNVGEKFDIVKNELLSLDGIKHVSGGNDNLTSFGSAFNGLNWPGKTDDQDFYITSTSVRYDWIKTAGLQLSEGRDFDPAFGADTSACLVNEAALKRMNIKQPAVGTKLGDHTLIGVVKDFVYNEPSSNAKPLIIFLTKNPVSNILVRTTNDGKMIARMESIRKVFKKIEPNVPFEYQFTSEEYSKKFDEIKAGGRMASFFGGMAIFISCLGLFGLSAFVAERRNKEISIRKILGASIKSIWMSLSKDFLKPVLIGFAIAAPLSAWMMNKILDKMDYRIEISWWMFVIAALVLLSVALITISFNGIKAAVSNPVKSLKSE
ncbi:ABC transporter permease [Flavitalea sp.]|nr:FtsX-like permease family protein [Flavitalea sp.]